MIERELVYKCEFGVDQSGSVEYLKYTLKAIKVSPILELFLTVGLS